MIRHYLLPLLLLLAHTLPAAANCDAEYGTYPVPGTSNAFHFEAVVLEGTAPFSYLWDFNDGNTADTPVVCHAFENNGNYNVTLSVTDAAGCISVFDMEVQAVVEDCLNYVVQAGVDEQGNLYGLIHDSTGSGNSPDMASWYFEGGLDYCGYGPFLFINPAPDAGVYMLCADYEDYDGTACFGTACAEIHILGEYDDCSTTDCVFPGDSDRDQAANVYDLLPIGSHFLEKGPTRDNPSTDWVGQTCQDWAGQTYEGHNLKHLDGNGDGTIDQADAQVILLNYNNPHNPPSPYNYNANDIPVYLQFEEDSISVNAEYPGMIDMTAYLMVGTPEVPAYGLHGIALAIDYPEDMVQEGSAQVSLLGQSFLYENGALSLHQETSDGFLDIAISRSSGVNANGFGAVARVNFTIIGDIVANRSPEEVEVPFWLSAQQVQGVNATGAPVGIKPEHAEMTFYVDRSSGLRPEILDEQIEISPNPAKDELNINLGTISAESVHIYSSTGQLLKSPTPQQGNMQLDVRDLPEGVYFLRIKADGKYRGMRFVIAR